MAKSPCREELRAFQNEEYGSNPPISRRDFRRFSPRHLHLTTKQEIRRNLVIGGTNLRSHRQFSRPSQRRNQRVHLQMKHLPFCFCVLPRSQVVILLRPLRGKWPSFVLTR